MNYELWMVNTCALWMNKSRAKEPPGDPRLARGHSGAFGQKGKYSSITYIKLGLFKQLVKIKT